MASVLIASNNSLPRSRSSTDLTDLSFIDFESPQPLSLLYELPRSASYTYLPIFEVSHYTDRKDSFSADSVPTLSSLASPDEKPRVSENLKKSLVRERESPKLDSHGRRQLLAAPQQSWIKKITRSPERTPNSSPKSPIPATPVQPPSVSQEKPKLAESFTSFARKSWISSSRPSTPSLIFEDRDSYSPQDGESPAKRATALSNPHNSLTLFRKLEYGATVSTEPVQSPNRSWVRKSLISRTTKRSQNDFITLSSLKSSNDSASSLTKSIDSVSSRPTSTESSDDAHSFAKDTLASLGIEKESRKDDLWSTFRSLEGDYHNFLSKSSALKTNVVRSSLLPFLKNFAQHPSDKNLTPEDLDRRVKILSEWWVALLEVLENSGPNSVTGIDRPVLLEATTAIMTRPEWRLAPSYFAPLKERLSGSPSPLSSSTSSLDSSTSQLMAESVYQKVRNTFIQNLSTQMSIVFNKMSMRHAPASLVTFCGKAVAYAFFFCPGVADFLVRVWRIPPETIRRAADELGLGQLHGKTMTADKVVSGFPPSLHSLAWTSTKMMAMQLRKKPNLPIGLSKIPWSGSWIGRWCGRDTDLFYVFCKHYHLLVEEFLHPDASLADKARAPGFVLVQAQILTILDSTFHREKNANPVSSNFDGLLSGAEASDGKLPLALPLHMPLSLPSSGNFPRLMSENRLVMLVRDVLSSRSSDSAAAQRSFANAFGMMMVAAAKRISLFDHLACSTLFDFAEEILAIYKRFHQSYESQPDYIDWRFWLEVCRKILDSENSMTEIRLFSFIYTVWNSIADDYLRKEKLCLEWLVSEPTFLRYFQHWCPMVRAHYMRLLCWRVCRHEGEATNLETKIFSKVLSNLKLVWSHYLYLKHDAERSGILPPSSAPSHPAPGRRIIILRSDTQIPTSSLFLGFDGLVSQSLAASSSGRHSTAKGTPGYVIAEPLFPTMDSSRGKKWSILAKMMPFNSPDGPGHGHDAPKDGPTASQLRSMVRLEEARLASAAPRKRPSLLPSSKSSTSTTDSDSSVPATPTFQTYTFRFSLEWSQQTQVQKNAFGQDRRLVHPRLPAPAQSWLMSRVPGTIEEVRPLKRTGEGAGTARYAGRALAEWGLIVMENNTFVERRRSEGVPNLKSVEVPTIGVEGFKKWGI